MTIKDDATVGQLKQLITDSLGLGVASTVVLRAVPLKDESKLLSEIGAKNGDTVIATFKKTVSAATAAVGAGPGASATTSSVSSSGATAAETTSSASATAPAAAGMNDQQQGSGQPSSTDSSSGPGASASSAPSSSPSSSSASASSASGSASFYSDWQCSMCTYINGAARSVCEMCETRNPYRSTVSSATRSATASTTSPSSGQPGSSSMDSDYMMAMALQQSMGGGAGAGVSGVDEEDDVQELLIGDEDEDGDEAINIDFGSIIAAVHNDSALANRLAAVSGVDVSTIQTMAARAAQEHPGSAMSSAEVNTLLDYLAQDPQAQQALGQFLQGGGDPAALQALFQQMFERQADEMMMEGEEDEDDFDEEYDPTL